MKTQSHRLDRTAYWNVSKEQHEDLIIDMVCKYFHQDRKDVLSKTRTPALSIPRHVIARLLYERTQCNTVGVQLILGYKNNASVSHAKKNVDNLLFSDNKFKKKYVNLLKDILLRELSEGIPPIFVGEILFVLNSIYSKTDRMLDRTLRKLYNMIKVMNAVNPDMNLHGTEIQKDVIRYIFTKT